jgi:hypothetical protein
MCAHRGGPSNDRAVCKCRGSKRPTYQEEEEEEEEMRSPGRTQPLANPMVPAGPHRSGPTIDEGNPDLGPSPVQHHGCGAPLRFLPIDS